MSDVVENGSLVKRKIYFEAEIEKFKLESNIPLSSAQKSIWFMDQMFPNRSVYNNPIILSAVGKLDLIVFKKALNEISSRHEILRTNFCIDNNEIKQSIDKYRESNISVYNLENHIENDAHTKAQDIINLQVSRPFDLKDEQLFRTAIIKKPKQENIIIFTFHHIIADGWSIDIFLKEFSILYNSYINSTKAELPNLEIQYGDYAIWQQGWLEHDEEKITELITFWKDNLENYPKQLDLPIDYKRPSTAAYIGATKTKKIPKSLSSKIRNFNVSNGVSMFMTTLAAYTVLIHRYTNKNDILVGIPIANRNKIELENLLGHFVNTLVIRSKYENNPSFLEHLNDIKYKVLDSFEYQDLPFEKLVEILNPDREIEQNPLFQVAFSYQRKSTSILDLSGLEISIINESSGTSKVDIYMVIEEFDDEMSITVEYNTEIYKNSTIERLLSHYYEILKEILINTTVSLDDISIINKEEKNKILVDFNKSSKSFDENIFVHQMFEENAASIPNEIACVFGEEKVTYGELNRKSNILAHELIKRGITQESIVGICINRSLDMIVSLLGVLKAGGGYLPIDPFQPKERIDLIINDAHPVAIITIGDLSKLFEKNVECIIKIDNLDYTNNKISNPNVKLLPENLAYIIYTSGTTGKPKGVLVNHIGLSNLASTEMKTYNITSESRILHVASFAFDSALYGILLALTQGAKLYIASLEKISSETDIIKMIYDWKITYTNLTPSILKTFNPQDVPSLRTVVSYGEELSCELVKKWSAKNRDIFNGYGPTETTIGATVSICSIESSDNPNIGKPFNNYYIYILDRKLNPVPIGIPGEIYIGGVGIARGYLGLPNLTAEKFLPDPFNGFGKRMYKTGDLGKFNENGDVEHIGRIDNQVKIRGYRIELRDIEQVISKYSSIKDVIVDTVDNGSIKKIVAYLVIQEGFQYNQSEILYFLKGKLPEYMVPTYLVELEYIPMTSGGKLDKKSLPQVEYIRVADDLPFLDPTTNTEKIIFSKWKEVLGIEKISINDNFFEIGGHSLLVAQLTFIIRKEFEEDIPMNSLFNNPTIYGMGKILDEIKEQGSIIECDNLNNEVKLDRTITPEKPFDFKNLDIKKIFLTGATGFVGAFLLKQLINTTNAEIYCLIRAKSELEARQKLIKNLLYYNLWNKTFESRIKIIRGDLSIPLFGLSKNEFFELSKAVDVIYHNGALVNLTFPYVSTKATNVLGTIEVIRLACKSKTKPIHFTSTLSVFSQGDNEVTEEDFSSNSSQIATGYSRSKWVSEEIIKIARKRGVPINIYRLGRVFGSSDTGICQPSDFLWKFIQVCIELGKIPKLNEYYDVLPVDFVTESMISLANNNNNNMRNFHIMSNEHLHFNLINKALKEVGYILQEVDYDKWMIDFNYYVNKNKNSSIYSAINLLLQNDSSKSEETLNIKGDYTKDTLASYGISSPSITKSMLLKTINHFIKIGHFTAPKRIES